MIRRKVAARALVGHFVMTSVSSSERAPWFVGGGGSYGGANDHWHATTHATGFCVVHQHFSSCARLYACTFLSRATLNFLFPYTQSVFIHCRNTTASDSRSRGANTFIRKAVSYGPSHIYHRETGKILPVRHFYSTYHGYSLARPRLQHQSTGS